MKVSNRFSVSTQDQFNDIFIVVKMTIGLRVLKHILFVTFENILNFNKSDKTHDFGQILKSEEKKCLAELVELTFYNSDWPMMSCPKDVLNDSFI